MVPEIPVSKVDYWHLMFGQSKDELVQEVVNSKNCGPKPRLLEAYEKAHDVRKFEISLYWRRALYFWGFEIAFLYGLKEVLFVELTKFPAKIPVLSVLTFFALLFTVLWLFALQGMKRWQENWELHIDCLEDCISGALYKTVLVNDDDQMGFYSVSRINEDMALFLALIWVFGWLYSLYQMDSQNRCIAILTYLFSSLIFAVMVYKKKTKFDDCTKYPLTPKRYCWNRGIGNCEHRNEQRKAEGDA